MSILTNYGILNYKKGAENIATNTPPSDFNVLGEDLLFTKTASPESGAPGTIVTYTIKMLNNGTIPLTNVVFTDILPAGLTLVAGSIKLNGVSIAGDLVTGIAVPNLLTGVLNTIEFKCAAGTPL